MYRDNSEHTLSNYQDVRGSRRAKRGLVKGFSRASQRRLTERLTWLDKSVMPLFVTLMNHDYWANSWSLKDDLRKFMQALRRRYPRAACIWRFAPQPGGAPRFYVLLYNVPFSARNTVADVWCDVIERSTNQHSDYLRLWHRGELNNHHCVQQMECWDDVRSYIEAYIVKTSDEENGRTGRIWGVINRRDIPGSSSDNEREAKYERDTTQD